MDKKKGSTLKSTSNEYVVDQSAYEKFYKQSIDDPEKFWGKVAKENIHWDKPFEKVLDNSNEPFTKWFVGGELNACYNAIDRHVIAGKGDKVAIIHDSPMTNVIRHVTYQELYDTTSRLAGGLKQLGITKGDRVVIYMPLIPEAIMAIMAVVRLGAVHSVVFGGFAASELCSRIEHCEPKIIIATNCGIEPNKIIPYLDILHDALAMSRWQPITSVIYQRENIQFSMIEPKTDISWQTILTFGDQIDCVPIESNEPLYILYTSGTTDNPKGVQRPVGHIVTLMHTMKTLYNQKPDDIWWSASDIGWVVGHSYICYAPLLLGTTLVMYEGKPDRTPDPGQYFRVIEKHQVTSLFSVPTAFRVIRRADSEIKYGKQYSTKSLKKIFLAGEHIDSTTKQWIENIFKVPVLNHWWQTETGSAITATCYGLHQSKDIPQQTTGLPYFGFDVRVINSNGNEAAPNESGRLVVKLPLPPGNFSTLYKNDEVFNSLYFQKYPGYYDTMDAGYKSKNGYVFVTARADDIINVSGHRISTASLEDAVLRHADIFDCAVFGVPEPIRGEIPCCLFITKEDVTKTSNEIRTELIKLVRDIIGPIASFRLAAMVNALPRTRSGKTMRKTLANFARNKKVILPATIEDHTVFVDIKRALNELGISVTEEPIVSTHRAHVEVTGDEDDDDDDDVDDEPDN